MKNMKKKYSKYKKYRSIKTIIEKRYNVLIGLITILITILFINLFYIQIIKNNDYKLELENLMVKVVTGNTSPRGRIYDRNYKLIVDNIPNKIIFYKKEHGVKTEEEIEYAYLIASNIDIDYSKLTDKMIRTFLVKKDPKLANSTITDNEWIYLKERKITLSDIEKYKLERVSVDRINNLNEIDKEAIYIYYLMNNGYSYSEKIIKGEGVTDSEYAYIATNMSILKGFDVRLDWNRFYLYGSVFRTILGNVSTSEVGIPFNLIEHYKDTDYLLNDRVGISYLEYMYDDYLKGKKDVYEYYKNGDKKLIESGNRGNDIVLTIDIELEEKIEKILEEEILKAKEEPNTEFYNRSFVIVSNPNTGEILAMSGKQIVESSDGYKFVDYTPGIITSTITVGSVIKGASQIVGYNNGGVHIGDKRYDYCVKLKGTNEKCSWKYLGLLDDIKALKYSSNTYQFYTLFNVIGSGYYYNMPLSIDESLFKFYRERFSEFGLGVKTMIDLPNEIEGYKGTKLDAGLLLDFVIGQYDNYTPIQLVQYINTIANGGNRLKPYLLKEVYSGDSNLENKIYESIPTVLNTLSTETVYLDRVKTGFKAVFEFGGTGYGYINSDYNPAGKTGTSQSFVDSNMDGMIDTATVTNTLAAYMPYDNPEVSFVIISPDTYNYNSNYESPVNYRISRRVSDLYYSLYKK